MINKVTPNFLKIFGYPVSQAELYNLNELLPIAFRSFHENHIRQFVEKNQSKKLDVLVSEAYGKHKNGYIFLVDIYIKIECFNSELSMVGCVHKKPNEREILLTKSNGYVMNFTSGFKNLLYLPINTNSSSYDLFLPLLIPRLIFAMEVKSKKFNWIYRHFNSNGIPNFDAMFENNDDNNDEYLQTGDIIDETVYAFFPKSTEIMNSIIGLYSKITKLNHKNENFKIDDYIKGAISVFDKFDENSFQIVKALISYKQRKFKGDALCIRIFDMIYPSTVKNDKKVIDAVRNYLQTLQEYYYDSDLRDAFEQFSIAFKKFSPLHEDMLFASIFEQNKTQEIIEVSDMDIDSMDNLDIVEREIIKEIVPLKQPHSLKELSSVILKKNDSTRSPGYVGHHSIYPFNSRRSSNINLINSERLASLDAIIETNEPVNSKNNNLKSLIGYHIINQLNDGLMEIHDEPMSLQRARSIIPSSLLPLYSPILKDLLETPNQANDKKISLKSRLNKNSKNAQVFGKQEDSVVIKLDHESSNEIELQPDNINNLMLRSEIQIQSQSNGLYLLNLAKEKKKENREFKERLSISSMPHIKAITKRFRNLLATDISISILDKVNKFGLLSIVVLIATMLALYILYFKSLQEYSIYTEASSFTHSFLSPIGSYAKFNQIQILYNNGLLNNLNFTRMREQSINLLNIKNKEYHNSYRDLIIGNSSINTLLKLNMINYDMNLTFLNHDDVISTCQYPFYYATQIILSYMFNIDNTIQNNDNNEDLKETQHLSEYFLIKNYPTYFNNFMKIIYSINDLTYINNMNLNLKDYVIIILILCISIGFTFAISVYPIFRKVENRKSRGLSLLSTFSLRDIESIQNNVKYIFLAIQYQSLLDIEMPKEKKNNEKQKTTFQLKNGTKKKKDIRDWKMKKMSLLKFLSIVILAFGLLSAYFIVSSIKIIKHDYNLNQFHSEYMIANNLIPCIQSEYVTAYYSLNLYSYNDNKAQSYFNISYMPLLYECKQKIVDIKDFWELIDLYIEENSDITNSYKQLLLSLKSNNLCEFINSIPMTFSMLSECENALPNAAANGIIQLINPLQSTLQTLIMSSFENFPNKINSQNLINSIDFEGFDSLMYYTNFIFIQYIDELRKNLKNVISNQTNKGYMYLMIGISLILLTYLIFWMPFLRHTKKEFQGVKNIYCLLPIETVISNHYIKKWLEDNTKKIDQT